MLTVTEFTDEQLIKRFRALCADLQDEDSPFNKDREYLRNLAGWFGAAATRIEKLSKDKPKDG